MSFVPIVFCSSNCLTTILFYRAAVKWAKLCTYISKIEAIDPNTDVSFATKCNLSCLVILTLALVEHVFANLSKIVYVFNCYADDDKYEAFILHSFPWVFNILNYETLVGVLVQFLNIQCTFNWNFADLFVICVSFYLISRLNQVYRKIVAAKEKQIEIPFWRSIREEYNRDTKLVRRFNDVIGGIIFISYANNLFFICMQLRNTLAKGIKATPPCSIESQDKRPLQGYEQAVYFMYSFIFLVVRSLSVSLIAAQVHTASLAPAQILYDIPSSHFNIEMRRLMDQIHGTTVALSGLQFFQIKRGLVLTIAGTIVTYELVLLQFSDVTQTNVE
ncbi:gustatory receptor for sugar taste 64e-like [Leptidea sinapis]|uniref:gustatory receptor for sugar taste 64e-like n=1 Tax=Leptidea sinapis TaxID=189913 RepID=UPI0021C2DEEF|nr:gustatory receptor for sugar taste 64e-like [Leptidea sinapis]